MKGLSSSRESARLGFASCLVQVLAQSPKIQLQDVMTLIEDSTKLTGTWYTYALHSHNTYFLELIRVMYYQNHIIITFLPLFLPSFLPSFLPPSYTQLGGAKRADERDLLFGRLFGCLALTRSGRLQSDEKIATKVFTHLVDLLNTKVKEKWLNLAFIDPSIYLSIYLSIYPSIHLSIHPSIYPSTSLLT